MGGNRLAGPALELVFPSFCHLCRRSAEESLPLCPDCLEQIERIGKSRCEICGKGFTGETPDRRCGDCLGHQPAFARARAFARYQDPMLSIIHRFKYNRGFYFLDWMIQGLLGVYQREFSEEKFELLVPIPLHWRRILRRGYNQAFILAKPLSQKLGIPIAPGALIRTRNTEAQAGLSPAQRKENVKKSFRVKSQKLVAEKRILLIDDVITTGITINEAAKTLKKAGAERVCALALART